MAGKKKQAQLTPEEKLQQALVPEAEQPYKVPANWCWTYLKNVSDCLDNFRKPINANERNARLGDIPYYGATGQVGWIDAYLTNEELVLLGEDGAPFLDLLKNKAYLINGKAWVNNHAHILRSKFGTMGNRLLVEYLNNFDFTGFVTGTTRLKLTQASMNKIIIPLPPLAEQQRIVERIESIFAKLDEAKENLQNILDGFETHKAAILHKAFSGELTANWRKQHGVTMDSWEEKRLGSCGSLQRGRSKHRPRNDSRLFGEKYPFIQTGDVANAEMYIINHSKMLSDFGLQQSKLFPKGTLCITIAANIGKVGILTYDCCFPDSVVGFLPNNENICEFIYYKLTTLQKELEELAPATAQKNINLKLLNDLKINMPILDEQTEIVRIIDDLLAKEQQAKELAENALAKIDLIKKSILARAFRGELGTNNPADEPAVELLKQVL